MRLVALAELGRGLVPPDTPLVFADDRIHLWVGGGIVWDSDPAAEIEESLVKARPLLTALANRSGVAA